MNEVDDELTQLLDEAVARLSTYRYTFTDEEALGPVWLHDYDISPQSDPQERFVLAYEADGNILASGVLIHRALRIIGSWMLLDQEHGMDRI
jgi:hypothetical protein